MPAVRTHEGLTRQPGSERLNDGQRVLNSTMLRR
jgi:hypothetical protein